MTRVEPPASERPVGRDDVKEIVRRELFLEIFRRKFFSCLGYLAVLGVVLGIPAVLLASYVAKTGFVELPVLTAWLHRPVEPIRVVRPSDITGDTLFLAIGARAKYEPITNLLTVTVRESELTALAVGSLRQAKPEELPFPIRDLQAAVDPDVVEIFATSPREGYDMTMRVRFEPGIQGGKLNLELKELRLGSADIPLAPAQFLVSTIARFATDALERQIADVGTIASVEAKSGELRLMIVPANR